MSVAKILFDKPSLCWIKHEIEGKGSWHEVVTPDKKNQPFFSGMKLDLNTFAILNKAAKEWFESPVFKERTLWSAYNACTEALKTSHPMNALEKYTKLHTFTEDYIEAARQIEFHNDDLPF